MSRSVLAWLVWDGTQDPYRKLRIRSAGTIPAGRAQLGTMCDLFGLANAEDRHRPAARPHLTIVA
jgi:hypothetical protein